MLLTEGDKIGPGEEVGEQIGHGKGLPGLQLASAAPEVFGQLTPADVRAVTGKPQQYAGVERFDAVVDPVLVQGTYRSLHQLFHVKVVGFQFHQQGRAVLKDLQNLLQQRNFLLGSFQTVTLELGYRQLLNNDISTGGAKKALVVDDGQTAILGKVDVQLDAALKGTGPAKGRHGVFRHALGRIMQPSVGIAEPA